MNSIQERINMNKGKLISLMAAALLCFSAASCGDKEKPPVGSSDEAATASTAAAVTITAAETETAAVSSETATESETTTAAETTTAEAPTESPDDRLADAVRLFEALNSADMMQSGSGVEIDENIVREFKLKINNSDVSSAYYMVTDSRFGSLEQVKQFVNDSLSGALLEKYKNIYEGDNAAFKEYSGYLYFIGNGSGNGFEYTDAPVVSSVTDSSFTASVSVNNYGTKETFTIKAVKEEDKWKASSLDIKKKQ